MCEPEVAAANIEFIEYSTPNDAAYELLDPSVRQNPISYPRQELLDNTEAFINLPQQTSMLLDKLWTEILSNDETYSKWTIPAFLIAGILLSIGINVHRSVKKKKESRMELCGRRLYRAPAVFYRLGVLTFDEVKQVEYD